MTDDEIICYACKAGNHGTDCLAYAPPSKWQSCGCPCSFDDEKEASIDALVIGFEHLQRVLKPFADVCGEALKYLDESGFKDPMTRRDLFMWYVSRGLCMKFFTDAKEALEKAQESNKDNDEE